MDDLKKISIKKYFEVYNSPEDIEMLFADISEQMEKYHNQNLAIGDFTTDNLYIGEDGTLGFNHISSKKEDIKKEQENDSYKYLVLLMSAYLNKTEQEDVKEKLKESSNLVMNDVIDFYSKNKNNLPPFQKIHSIASTLPNYEDKGDNTESKGTVSKSLVKSNGHSLVQKDKYRPNAFVSLFVFPFVMIYLFLILALLYWMIVLK